MQILINIEICDIDFENELINYRHTKNRKIQAVFMSITLNKVLVKYPRHRKGGTDEYLFVNAYG